MLQSTFIGDTFLTIKVHRLRVRGVYEAYGEKKKGKINTFLTINVHR